MFEHVAEEDGVVSACRCVGQKIGDVCAMHFLEDRARGVGRRRIGLDARDAMSLACECRADVAAGAADFEDGHGRSAGFADEAVQHAMRVVRIGKVDLELVLDVSRHRRSYFAIQKNTAAMRFSSSAWPK